MDTNEAIERLNEKGIKPTANRILVCRELARRGCPMSLADMEEAMPEADRSSIFRVLTLFQEHDLVHTFTDGRGVLHYELCHSHGECHMEDRHLHFYCETCHRSYCLEDTPLPHLTLPAGFEAHSWSFVVKGQCPHCARRNFIA